MKNRTYKCGWCSAETKPVYQLKDRKYLCLECAEKHYNYVNNKMEKHIQEIRNGLSKKRKKISDLKMAMCNHENMFDTGYCVGKGNKIKFIWKCPDCNKTFYRDDL